MSLDAMLPGLLSMSIAARHASRSVKELLQPLKHLMLGAMSANSQNVFQLLDLLDHLFKPRTR